MARKPHTPWTDALLHAGRRFSVVSREELLDLGLTGGQIDYALRTKRLTLLHRGVYLITGAVASQRSHWRAAVLAVEGTIAARDAAALRDLRPTSRSRIDLIVPSRRKRPKLDLVETRLADDEVEVIDGIPCTSLHRTYLDLATVVKPREVQVVMERALRRDLGDRVPLSTMLDRHPRHPGTRVVRGILGSGTLGRTFTRSDFEEALLPSLDRHGVQPPDGFNVQLPEGEVDAVWWGPRVVLELDSREHHDNPVSFAADRRKSRKLGTAGWQPVRVAPEHFDDADLAHDLLRLGVLPSSRPAGCRAPVSLAA